MTKHLFYLVIMSTFFVAGCSTRSLDNSQSEGPEKGYIWCNERYLPAIDNEIKMRDSNASVLGSKYYKVAKEGYMYSLAAALVLQYAKGENDSKHSFMQPRRLVTYDVMPSNSVDFEAQTFLLYSNDNLKQVEKIIVAFTGTNSIRDWGANLFPTDGRVHYGFARSYILNLIPELKEKYSDIPIIVTGYSLGGGLAVHVTKHKDTSHFIDQTWVFNSSPKTYADGKLDDRIWSVSIDNEILVYLRGIFKILPGVTGLGSKESHTAEKFPLDNSNTFYAHSRWLLAREMLHVADLAMYLDNPSDELTEPMFILQGASDVGCVKN
jgi:hypothetical protein